MANQNQNPSGIQKLAGSVTNLAGAVGTVVSTGAKATGGVAQGGAGIAGRAAGGSAGLLGGIINTVANTARRFPKISFLVATYASIKGVQHVLRKNKEKKEVAAQQEGQVTAPGAAGNLDPRTFEQQYGQSAASSVGDALSPEQQAFIRELQHEAALQQQGGAAVAEQDAAAGAEKKWAAQIASEREQAARGPIQNTR